MAIRSTGFALLKSNEGCHRYALAIAWQVSKANFLLASQRSSPLGGVPSSQRSTWLVPPQPPAFPRRWRSSTSHKPLLSSFRVIASFHGFVSWSPNHSKKTWREFSRRRSRPSHRATNARLRVAQADPSAHERHVHACEEGVRRRRTATRAKERRNGRAACGARDEADELAHGCTSSKRSA